MYNIVSEKGVEVDPGKIICVSSWAIPLNRESFQQFQGFASYNRKFVPNFAQIAAPQRVLTAKSSCGLSNANRPLIH